MTDAPRRRGRPLTPRNLYLEPKETIMSQEAVERAPMRAPMREEDPRAAAERRAQQILENMDGSNGPGSEFTAPKPPDGWSYEWKRQTIWNQPDPSYQVALADQGWEPVPVDRHPKLMPIGATGAIAKKGMMLMERPAVITDMARRDELDAARERVQTIRDKLGATPQGHLPRDADSRTAPRVKNGYGPSEIPDK